MSNIEDEKILVQTSWNKFNIWNSKQKKRIIFYKYSNSNSQQRRKIYSRFHLWIKPYSSRICQKKILRKTLKFTLFLIKEELGEKKFVQQGMKDFIMIIIGEDVSVNQDI